MHGRIDPGALLVAVLIAGIGPITTDGPWSPISGVISLVVGVIVGLFMWPSKQLREASNEGDPFNLRALGAQALVYGLLTVSLAAWPIQGVLAYGRATDCGASEHWFYPRECSWGTVPDDATYLALVVGLVATCVFFWRLKSSADATVPQALSGLEQKNGDEDN